MKDTNTYMKVYNRAITNTYLKVAEIVATYITGEGSLNPFTCNEIKDLNTEAYYIYCLIYEFTTPASDNEESLWEESKIKRKEHRLMMLCLASAIVESGGLYA